MSYTDRSFVEIHPDTAEEYGLSNGDMLDITSRHGETQAMAQITRRPSPEEIFIPIHFMDDGANNLTKEEPLDGPSRAPEYKVADVQISVTESETDAPAASVPSAEADDRTAESDD